MMKLRQKISGGFRSLQGAIDFATVRSFISTARKQGWNIIDALTRDPANSAQSLRSGNIIGGSIMVAVYWLVYLRERQPNEAFGH
jgi:hypothetical protein